MTVHPFQETASHVVERFARREPVIHVRETRRSRITTRLRSRPTHGSMDETRYPARTLARMSTPDPGDPAGAGEPRKRPGRRGRSEPHEPRDDLILFLHVASRNQGFKLGGFEVRMTRILAGLADRGWRCTIIVTADRTVDRGELRAAYARVFGDAPVAFIVVDSVPAMARELRVRRPRCVAYSDPHRKNAAFIALCALFGIRSILMNVTTDIALGQHSRKRQGFLFDVAARVSTRIDTLYPSGAANLNRKYPHRVSLAPGAFSDYDVYRPGAKKKSIVFLGALEPIKNPLLLLQAAFILRDRLMADGVVIRVCGSGTLFETCSAYVRTHDLADVVHLEGQAVAAEVLPGADIMVSIQSHNNYPSQALIEALACGCRVVVSDEGDSAQMVSEEFGKLVPLDARRLADALGELLDADEFTAEKARHAARAFVTSRFPIDAAVDHVAELARRT